MKQTFRFLFLFLLLPISVQAQKSVQDERWDEVERLLNIKNYEQTLPILADIKSEAKRQQHTAGWVRAFLAESNIYRVNETDDEAFAKIQDHFLQHIAQSDILERSVLLNFYARFLDVNRYRYKSESRNVFIAKNEKEKQQTVDSLFALAIAPKESLVNEPIEKWKDVFQDTTNLSLIPTLYHLLAYSYMGFSADSQKVEQLKEDLLHINADKGYDNATSYLLWTVAGGNPSVDTLKKITERQESDYNAFILHRIAHIYYTAGQKKEAEKYVKLAVERYPRSPWLGEAKSLYERLNKVDVSVQHAHFTPSAQYTPIKIHTMNADSIFIRVYRTTQTPKEYQRDTVKYDSTTLHTTLDAPLIYEERVALKKFDDFEAYSTIYKLNPLPYGNYTLLTSNNKDFKDDGRYLDVVQSSITVTDLFISTSVDEEDKNGYKLFTGLLIDRKTGLPYANQKMQLYETDPTASAKPIESVKTNSKGAFSYKSAFYRDDIGNYALFVPQEKQLLELSDLEEPDHVKKEKDDSRDYATACTFTDRAIYRPGQTVYFKSILYDSHALLGKIIESQTLQIRLYDANRQLMDSLLLTTNEFGSVHGSFAIPSQTLSGLFQLVVLKDNRRLSSNYVRVEEYKRPTFKVTFDTNKETYTRQDTAIFTGRAEMLSGVPLAGSAVHGKATFYSSRQRKQVTLVDSNMIVDGLGRFAIKVPLMDSVFNGLENFSIQYLAEVINQTGEMHAVSGVYNFSVKPWKIRVQTEPLVEENKWARIHVVTRNQNNQPLGFAGTVNIYKMTEPQTALSRESQRYFKEVGYHLLDNKQYEEYFPHYFDEWLTEAGEQKTFLQSYSFDGRDTSLVRIDSHLFPKGRYQIEAVSVQQGDTIRAYAETYIFEPELRKTSDRQFLGYHLDKSEYQIGDKVNIIFYTDTKQAKTLFLFQSRGEDKIPVQVLRWNNGMVQYSFVLQKEHISPDLRFTALLILNNQAEMVSITLPIAQIDKKLHFHTTTFRDKITPGAQEKWQFKIENKDHAVTSEVLATMYDVSLDAFATHNFPNSLNRNYPYYAGITYHYLLQDFRRETIATNMLEVPFTHENLVAGLPRIRSYGLWTSNGGIRIRGMTSSNSGVFHAVSTVEESASMNEMVLKREVLSGEVREEALYHELKDSNLRNEVEKMKAERELHKSVNIRSNLQETAFFFPTLYTDEKGNVSFAFDSPEALTKWKLLLFAHGKNLEAGAAAYFTQTQKHMMVRPNLPRYFREGDEIVVKAQVQNMTETALSGDVHIAIINPQNNRDVTHLFVEGNGAQGFQAMTNTNTTVAWKLRIPANYPTVHIKIVATSDTYSDGEMHELPILPAKILISDTEKIVLQADVTKDYMIKSAGKQNLHAKVQVQSNPILEIIGAVDYVKSYPYESNEQLGNKWFGLKMVEYIRKEYPAITQYFQSLSQEETKGKLEENATLNELKLEEMPWLHEIAGEEEKLKRMAKLFQTNIQNEIQLLERKITSNQLENGAFAWFDRGKVNGDISIRLLELMGKVLYLDKSLMSTPMRRTAQKLIGYLDTDSSLFRTQTNVRQALDYLYARQYWNGHLALKSETIQKFGVPLLKSPEITAKDVAGVAAKAWVVNQLFGEAKQANEIKNRIAQEAIHAPDVGMYWESNNKRYNAVSLQSYMVEAYKLHDPSKLNAITQWLYYKKQDTHWNSTWMTIDAIYALLLANNPADFVMGNTVRVWVNQKETETDKIVLGQVTKSWATADLQTDKEVRIRNENNRTIYGGIYHQYFVPAEQITKSSRGISVQKQYFVQRNGEWMETQEAKLGERIKVSITVINDQALPYVHLKDSRPSGVEVIYQPSGYKWWQGYYFTMKDASTHYFFDYLPKGRRVYEYEVKANNLGVFSSGMTTIECLYDPTVNARSANTSLVIVE